MRRTTNEKFNYVHSSLRNIIERCFKILKAHFPIFEMIAPYPLTMQRNIVVVMMAIHNFICHETIIDQLFCEYEEHIVDDEDSNEEDDNELNLTQFI